MFFKVITPILIFLLPQPVHSGFPIIGPGREDEVKELFSACGKGETHGWSVPSIRIPRDRIRVTFTRASEKRVILEFRKRTGDRAATSKTRSFEVFVFQRTNVTAEQAAALARAAAKDVSRNDRGTFWTKPSSEVKRKATAQWGPSVWLAGFGLLLALLVLTVVRYRLLQHRCQLIALLELVALVAGGLIVRLVLIDPGPGNLYSRLPLLAPQTADMPQFGPGFAGWIRFWYVMIGRGDTAAFVAGAVAGTLTAVPVYLLSWFVSGRRSAGLIAGLVLVFWPIHARHSPTDDPASLIALLVVSSFCLVFAAERTGAVSLLVAAWLAGALAAAVRPEPALCLIVLVALIVTLPKVRSMQLRAPGMIASVVCSALAVLILYYTVTKASATFSPIRTISFDAVARLLGWQGGSVLVPPRSSILVAPLVGFGCIVAWKASGARILLLMGGALLPALPTAALAGTDFITARYQLALIPVAAAVMGTGLATLSFWISQRLKRWRNMMLPIISACVLLPLAWPLTLPDAEPSFRLEYAFFRKHIRSVPRGCRIIQITWSDDRGLGPPTHLTNLLKTGHEWIPPSKSLNVASQCVVLWKPASCRSYTAGERSDASWILPQCRLIENAYKLEPIAETKIPARTGFCDQYVVNPVPVGFYRLRPSCAWSVGTVHWEDKSRPSWHHRTPRCRCNAQCCRYGHQRGLSALELNRMGADLLNRQYIMV